MKWLFRLVILAVVLGGLFFISTFFDVSGDKDGLHITKDKDNNWELPDGKEVVEKIKNKTEDMDWDRFKAKTEQGWNSMSKKMKDFSEDFNLEEAGDSARDSIDSLQQKARKKYDKLVKKWEKGDLTSDAFQKKLEELNAWVTEQMNDIKERFQSR